MQRSWKNTGDEDVTQERVEECQGGLPGGDAAHIAYSNKSKVLRVESLGKVCSVSRWQSAKKVQGHTRKSMEPCMEAARYTALQLRVGREALLPAVCRLQSVGGLRQWEAGTAGDSFTETGLTVQTNNQHPPLPFSNYSLHQNLLEGNTDGWSPPPEFLAGLS